MQFSQDISASTELVLGETRISQLDERRRYSLRLKRDDIPAANKIRGWQIPSKVGETVMEGPTTISCVGPDEWFILTTPDRDADTAMRLVKLADKALTSITDISHRNVAFLLEGEGATTILNVGCPLDLSLSTFPVGKSTRSIFENAPVIIIRTAKDIFHVECWRSFAPYLWTFFETIAAEHAAK
jgi:sarcosine oxidase subunit gamma